MRRGLAAAAVAASVAVAVAGGAQAAPGWPGKRTTVTGGIGEAESIVFTPEGRLFVSGHHHVWEITRDAKGRTVKTDVFVGNTDGCTVEGIVQRGDYLYGACWVLTSGLTQKSWLVGGKIDGKTELRKIAPLPDGMLFNGWTVGPGGHLYVADSTGGFVHRVVLDGPEKVAAIERWSPTSQFFLNGIKVVGDHMYFTAMDAGKLSGVFGRFPIRADGTAGPAEILYSRFIGVLDDFTHRDGSFYLTDYLGGKIVEWRDGRVVRETASKFSSPTFVAFGQAPLFSEKDLLVTEKGLIFFPDDGLGDRLSVWR